MIHVAPVIMLALLLAAIIITVNAIQRGKKRKLDEAKALEADDAFVMRLLEQRRALEAMERRLDEYKSRLSAEASDHDKETPRGVK